MKLFFLSLILVTSAYAQPRHKEPFPSLTKSYQVSTVTSAEVKEDTQKLFAHLSLAAQSIDYGLKTSALDHLATARAEATGILNEKKELTQELGNFSMGKISTGEGETERHYFAPVWVGEEVDEVFKDSSLGKQPKLEVTKSSIIQTTVRMDVVMALKRMNEVVKHLEQNNYDKARDTMDSIYDEVLVDEKVISEPILNVWSNLVLAQAFVQNGTYGSAKFSLKKAKASLADLEKSKKVNPKSAEAKELHRELDSLTKELDEKAPGFLARVKKKIRDWTQKTKSWVP